MSFTSKQVSDLDTLKAVSHPLRMSLLGELRSNGPATASDLGRRLGESSGSTSYHLRQLERFGFVGDDVEQPSGRERRWRALHDLTEFPAGLAALDSGREHLDGVRRRQEELLRADLEAWTEPATGLGHSDYLLCLTPDEREQLNSEIEQVIGRYTGRDRGEHVAVHVLTLPSSSRR